MSNASSSISTPAGTGAADDEEHEPTEIREQDNTQSPVSNTDANLLEHWASGLSMENRLKIRKNDFTEEERTEAWKVVDEAVKVYSDEMVQRWIAEMDTLLVYAGLFSAVLTAFNVESYSLLSPTAPDPVLAALTQISAQLASFSVHDPFVNSTQSAFQQSFVSSDSTAPQRWVVWLNILWFSSLICSLSAAFVAIMVKQWIHEYKSGISGSSRNTARLRQHRYNGLVKWKVATIIAVLPILLQMASGLFMAGLLVLLWNLNRTVAIVASALVGMLLTFTLVTIILPAFTSNCAYLSPLSLSLFRSWSLSYSPVRTLIRKTAFSIMCSVRPRSTLGRFSEWLYRTCLDPLSPSVHAMQSAYVTRNLPKLDQDIFVTAYSTTGDLGLLEHASTSFSDHSIADLSQFLTRIHVQNKEHGQTATIPHWTHHIPVDVASDMLLVWARTASSASGETADQNTDSLQTITGSYLLWSHVVPDDQRINCALSNMAAVLYNGGNSLPDSFPLKWCLKALREQLDSVKDTKSPLVDDARRGVIAAIFTVVRTSMLKRYQWRERGLCLDVLDSCCSSSISHSRSGDSNDEEPRRTPLADVLALAEDALITMLRFMECPNGLESNSRCFAIEFFVRYYQRIGLEQLASRVTERMLRGLGGAIKDLPLSSWTGWDGFGFCEMQKDVMLEWMKSLEKERDKQIAAEENQRREPSTRTAWKVFEEV